jgi:hypothetical protein
MLFLFEILVTCVIYEFFAILKTFLRISAGHISFWHPYCAVNVCDVPIVSAAVA